VGETRKIAAILVADVVGYSRLAGADEDRTLSRLRGLRSDLIDPAIDAHHGRIVKRTGDGNLIEFRSVVDAVRCAIEVQNGLIERNAGVAPDKRIEFRIGIHLGDVVEESDGDLMGDGVNIAARLEGIAKPGAICLSEDAYRQVSGRLDMQVTDLGPTQLKNIERSIRVYSLQVGVPAQPKPVTEAKPLAPKKRSGLAVLGAAIVALIVFAAGSAYYLYANRTVTEAAGLSIVVLPFTSLSGDPAQDYLADALTDELTTSLARLPNSFVIARNTAFTYRGKPVDAKAIGKDLGVRYVLEGSVQPGSAEVRVNAQLIDAESGAHLWAEKFDTPRADVLRTQEEIVAHLASALEIRLPEVEAARLKRTPAANPNAEDLALQCVAAVQKGEGLNKEAEAGYRLCEQALAVDPDNVRALNFLSLKFWLPVVVGQSVDAEGGLKRGEDLVSKALALDPNSAVAHLFRANILAARGRHNEQVAEDLRALALDPAAADASVNLGWAYVNLGQFEKGHESLDRAIRISPYDPSLYYAYGGKATAYFGLEQYDPAIEWARKAIAINPNHIPNVHFVLIAALALAGHDTDAKEALRRYLALPSAGPRTIAAFKAFLALYTSPETDPRYLKLWDRAIEEVRKAGLPEE
jgi:adenylate cyclase